MTNHQDGGTSVLQLRVLTTEHVLDVGVGGELDLADADRFADEVSDALDPAVDQVRIDLTDLELLSAAGVGALVTIKVRADRTGAGVTLVEPRLLVRRVLDLCGMFDEPGFGLVVDHRMERPPVWSAAALS